MSTQVSYPHIEKPEDGPARLQKTPRVRVAQIAMDYLNYGWSVDEMCRQHPYLSAAEAHAAMAYYFDHQAEIEAEIEAELKEVDEARAKAPPSPFVLRMRAQGLM
ncbi:MAG TPA: DUF433 domain-containing protein [Thermoguttaceae bacterium]|nr:DUF433 domain-containing protein [Thermoguttaceae bacterium]